MALTGIAKTEFIEGLTKDLLKNMPEPSPEVRAGMVEYATALYERIHDLIRHADIVDRYGNPIQHNLK